MIPTTDIVTSIVRNFENFSQGICLGLRQGWLWTRLLLHRKKTSINYFENIQQDLINDVPAYLCWDAKYFYKAKINGIDVTFDKTPLFTSEKYTGKFKLTVYGLSSKETKTISLNVKSYEQTKKIKGVQPKIKLQRTKEFTEIEDKLLQIQKPKIRTKKIDVNIRQAKLQKLAFKNKNIIGGDFIKNLNQHSNYQNYQNDFYTELKKLHGK